MSTTNHVDNITQDFNINLKDSFVILAIVAGVTSISNWAGTGNNPIESLPGMLILCGMIGAGILLKALIPIGFPTVAWVSLVSVGLTLPVSPVSGAILEQLESLSFLSLVSPVLAYAALAITKLEVDLFKKSGIKIAIISVLVFTGTYLGSVIVADLILGITG